MRDIKIRAWQIQTGEMYYNVNPIYHKNGELDFLVYVYSNTGYDMVEINIEKYDSATVYDEGVLPVILMQYTGLKDKNGVDIYDGDILRVALITGKTTLCEVVYNLLHARFEYVVLDMPVISYSVSEVEEVVVIGNIHENKDLLECE